MYIAAYVSPMASQFCVRRERNSALWLGREGGMEPRVAAVGKVERDESAATV
jgi:hypothetical protein